MTDDAETSLHVYMTDAKKIQVLRSTGGLDLEFYGKSDKMRTAISITKEQAKSLVINLVKVIGDE